MDRAFGRRRGRLVDDREQGETEQKGETFLVKVNTTPHRQHRIGVPDFSTNLEALCEASAGGAFELGDRPLAWPSRVYFGVGNTGMPRVPRASTGIIDNAV